MVGYAMNIGGSDFELPDPGTTRGVLCQWIDLGTIYVGGRYAGNKRMVRLAWEVEQTTSDGRPLLQFARYTLVWGENSNLRKMLEDWRGRRFSETETFDPENVLGQTCLLNLVRSDDDKWSNVASVMPLPKGMEPLTPQGSSICFQFEDPNWADVYSTLPERLKQQLAETPEFKGIDPKKEDDQATQRREDERTAAHERAQEMEKEFDDDIPF